MSKVPQIVIPVDVIDIKECVYKLFYGEKYVIVMGKSVYRTVWSINDDLVRFQKGVRENTKIGLYGVFCQYVLDNPGKKFSFEMLIVSENPYELLKCCQLELDKGINDCRCLNTNTEPYLSRNIQCPPLYLKGKSKEQKYWINRGYYLNFRKWQYNRHLRAI